MHLLPAVCAGWDVLMPQVISDLGNGIILRVDGCVYRFDPKRVVPDDANLVSHAHSDHVPSGLASAPVVCSPATCGLMRVRRRKVERRDIDGVRMVEAGHAPGSCMFIVGEDIRTMYTGDFCTRRKRHLAPAKPHRCDILVMESTYGKAEYEFPDHEETIDSIRDWVGSVLGGGANAVLIAYPLGKAQELCYELRDFPIVLQGVIADNNQALAEHGFRLPDTRNPEALADRGPFVYVTSGFGVEHEKVVRMTADGARVASFSGWSSRRFGRGAQGRSTEMFPLSDHCDYNELMEFVRLCNPGKVFTTHGFAEEFARSIRRELHIDAEQLRRGQETLDGFV